MVDCMSVVMNVMFSLIPYVPVSAHGGIVMYFGSYCFRGALGFLNCYDICMCVVNK